MWRGKKILAGYSVLVMDGKISSVDKDKMYKLPGSTTVIDGTGKYLVPGFTDAHVHFFQSGGIYADQMQLTCARFAPIVKRLNGRITIWKIYWCRYLSVGITSVIDVGASNNFYGNGIPFATKPWSPQIKMRPIAYHLYPCSI